MKISTVNSSIEMGIKRTFGGRKEVLALIDELIYDTCKLLVAADPPVICKTSSRQNQEANLLVNPIRTAFRVLTSSSVII